MRYFEKEGILHVVFADGTEDSSVELSPELNAEGKLIGVEILNASTFIWDTILETVQARALAQADVKTA